MDAQTVLLVMQMILSFGNICIIGYAFIRFVNKPHSTLESKHEELVKRVDKHDVRLEDIEESLHRGNDKFREQASTNTAFREIMLAFVDFEIAYCIHTGYEHQDDLKRAKKKLEEHLSRE